MEDLKNWELNKLMNTSIKVHQLKDKLMKFEYLEARIYSDHTWFTVTEKNGLTPFEQWEYSHLEVLDKLGLDGWRMCSEHYSTNNERVITFLRHINDE